MTNSTNQDALNANRQGRYTFVQGLALAPWLFAGGMIFLIGGSMFVAGIYNLYNLIVNHVMQNGTIIGLLMFFGIGGWLLVLSWQTSQKTILDLFFSSVISIDGHASKSRESTRNGRGSVCYYSVGKLSFQIPSQGQWEKLPTDCYARVYYTPNSLTFINVEVLQPARSG